MRIKVMNIRVLGNTGRSGHTKSEQKVWFYKVRSINSKVCPFMECSPDFNNAM